MAAYSFAPSNISGNWGGSSWSGLGAALLTGTQAGFNYLDNLYNLQNRVMLDQYSVPAMAEQYNAERNRAMLSQMTTTGTADAIARMLRTNAAGGQNITQPRSEAPSTQQIGAPPTVAIGQGVQDIINNTAQRATSGFTPSSEMNWLNPSYVLENQNKTLLQSLGLGGY